MSPRSKNEERPLVSSSTGDDEDGLRRQPSKQIGGEERDQGRDVFSQDVVLRARSSIMSFGCITSFMLHWYLDVHALIVNVDAAWNAEMRFVACGAIVCDHDGMVLAGFTCLIVEAFHAPSVETLTLACATQKALEKGFSRVVLEFN
ncbi:hypothetical protein GOBAR_DD05163 [Gossypium barbadense]|nr:hypothetical protein GOBAR_DD05163 [Gossypium barbadense]